MLSIAMIYRTNTHNRNYFFYHLT